MRKFYIYIILLGKRNNDFDTRRHDGYGLPQEMFRLLPSTHILKAIFGRKSAFKMAQMCFYGEIDLSINFLLTVMWNYTIFVRILSHVKLQGNVRSYISAKLIV